MTSKRKVSNEKRTYRFLKIHMGKTESQIRLNVNIYKYVQSRRDNPNEMIARQALTKSIPLMVT